MMALDEEARQKELERKRLIEQIRKRAEEAELSRIEEDEGVVSPPMKEVAVPQVTPLESPALPTPTPPATSPGDQRKMELREKLIIALDRGLSDKAATLFAEISTMIPDDPELRTYQSRLAVLQEGKQGPKVQRKGAEKGDRGKSRAQIEEQRKKIADLIEKANGFYQREKYEKALELLEEVQALDPDHEEARSLFGQVEKARRLAEELKQEEMNRKAALAATQPAAPAQPVAKQDGDVWGAPTAVARSETVFEDQEEQAAKEQVKPSLLVRATEWAKTVRIPVKPIITTALVIAASLAAYFIFDAITGTVFPPKHSLLVFPPTTDVTEGSADYRIEGLTEELIRDLSVIPDLRLIAPATAMTFLDPRTHNAQTAKALVCMHFVQWSFTQQDDGITFAMSLYDTASNTAIWDFRQQVSLREVPAFRLELARMLVQKMGAELSPEVERTFSSLPTENPEAYNVYLRARSGLRHKEERPITETIQMFETARSLDSGFAEIHSGRGWAHILAYESGTTGAKGHLTEALRSVQRALALKPRSAEALRVWGMAHYYSGEYARALDRMREAVALAPADAETHQRLALLYLVAGRADEAVRAAGQAVALDPRNVRSHTMLGQVRQYRGQYMADNQEDQKKEFRSALQSFESGAQLSDDRAKYRSLHNADIHVYLQQHDKAAELLVDRIARERDSYEDVYRLGRVLQSGGKPTTQWQEHFIKARRQIQERLAREPNDAIARSYLSLVHTRMGESREATAAMNRALALAPGDVTVLYNTARAHAIRRENNEALTYISKGIEGAYDIQQILDMDFFNLRNDSDFRSAITR